MAGELHFMGTIDNSQFLRGIQQMQDGIREVTETTEQEGKAMEALAGKIGQAAAAMGVGFSAAGFVKQVAQTRGEFQALEASFRTLIGSEEEANALMQQLTETAASTPFDLKGIADGAKQLMAYGESADKVNDRLIELGNIAAGLSLPLSDLVTLYGSTVSKMSMDSLDLKQFKSRGIAIDEAIAEVMKVTKEEVPKLISAGQVTGDIVTKAVESLATGTGKFAGLMEAQSKTILGQISNIGDSIDMMFNQIGQSNEGLISDTLSGVSYIIENYEKIGKAIAEIVAAYGVYKGVLASVAAYNKAMASQEAAALKAVLASKEEELSADLKRAVQAKAITQEKAVEIELMRKEAAQRVAALKLTSEQAAAEAALAAEEAARVQAQALSAANRVQVLESELAAKVASGDATAIETAEIELNEAANRKDALARQANAAATNAQAKQAVANAAATKYETAQTALSSSKMAGMTKSTRLLATAQAALGKVMKATGLSMLANPYVLAAAAVAALGYAIYKVVTYQSDAEKSAQKVRDAWDEGNAAAAKELTTLSALSEKMKGLDKDSDEYKNTRQQIIDQYGQYHKGLDTEIDKLMEEGRLYDTLSGKIVERYRTEARAKAEAQAVEDLGASRQAAVKDFVEEVDDRIKELEKQSPKLAGELKQAMDEIRDAAWKGDLSYDDKAWEVIGIDDKVLSKIKDNHLYKDLVELAFEMRKANRTYAAAMDETERLFGKGTEQKKEQNDDAGKVAQKAALDVKTLERVTREIQAKQKELDNARKKLAAGATYQEGDQEKDFTGVVDKAEEDLKTLKELYKKMTGLDFGNAKKDQAEQMQKLKAAQAARLALEEQLAKESLEHTKQQYREAQQVEIDLMDDSTEKRLAQRRLDQVKELDKIEAEGEALKAAAVDRARQLYNADQEVAAAADKNYVKKEFDAAEYIKGALGEKYGDYSAAEAQIDEYVANTIAKIQERQAKDDAKFWNDELKKTQDFANSYLEILIQAKQKEKDIDKGVKLLKYDQETADKLKAINQKDLNDKLDASGLNKEALLSTFKDFTDVAADVVEGNIRTVIDKYEAMYATLSEAQKNTPEGLAILAKISAAKRAVQAAADKGTPDNTDVKKWEMYESAIDSCVDAGMQLAETMGAANDETGKQIMQIASLTMGIVSNVGRFVNESISAIKAAETAGVTAVRAVEAASVILLVIDAIIQVTQVVVNLISKAGPLKQFQKDVDELNDRVRDLKREMYLDESLNDTIFDNNIWADLVENGRKSTEKVSEYVEKVRGMLTSKMIDSNWADTTILQALNTWKAGTANATIADYTGINVDEVKDMESALNAMGKALGAVSVQTQHSTWFRKAQYTSLANLNPDLYNEDGSINMDALKEFQSTETYKHLASDQREYIEEMIEAWEDYQQASQQLSDMLKDTFSGLGSTLGDAIEQAFLQGEGAADDFRTSVADMLNDMAKQMSLSLVFGDMFERYQDEFKKIYTDQSYDNNETRMAAFVEAASRMTDEAVEGMDEAVNIYGSVVDMINQKIGQTSVQVEQEQKANYGGYETISEETGSELSGRATAMYLVQSEHLEVARTMLDTISNSAAVVNNINITVGGLAVTAAQQLQTQNAILSVVRTYTEEAGASLANIAKYTKNLE